MTLNGAIGASVDLVLLTFESAVEIRWQGNLVGCFTIGQIELS